MDTEQVDRAVKPTLKALDAVLSLIDRAKGTSVPLKGSVWSLATSKVVGLEKFEASARDLRRELKEWQDKSESLERSLRELEEAVEEADEEGTEADYDRIIDEFSEAMRSMEALDEKSARVETKLRDASERSGNIAERAGGIPVLGSEIQEKFKVLSIRLSKTADEVVRTNRKPSDVMDVYVHPTPEKDGETVN